MPLTVAVASGLDTHCPDLPEPVLKALDGFRSVQALPRIGPADHQRRLAQAVNQVASDAARKASTNGGLSIKDIDVAAIAKERRQCEVEDDAYNAVTAVRNFAGVLLIESVANHRVEVIKLLRERHRVNVDLLAGVAKHVPPDMTEHKAMRAGGEFRTAWLRAEDCVRDAEALRNAVLDVADEPYRGNTWHHPMAVHLAYVKTTAAYLNRTRQGGYFGNHPAGSIEFYLGMMRTVAVDDVWAPTLKESSALAAKLWPERLPSGMPGVPAAMRMATG